MSDTSQVLALISKLMIDNLRETDEITDSYRKLYGFFNGDFVKTLDQGYYNDSATLISEIRHELLHMRFWDSVPMLFARYYINVFSALEDMRQYINRIVELKDWFFENDSIPVVFVHSNVDETTISAVTYDEKIIKVSEEEYVLICNELDNYNIEQKKLVRFFIVEINNWNTNNCLCIWQEKIFEENDVVACFQKVNSVNIVFGKSISHINRRLLSINFPKICVLSSDEVLTQLAESLIIKSEKIGTLLPEEKFFSLLYNKKGDRTYRDEINKIRLQLFRVEAFYNYEISKIKLIKEEMHDDLLHLSEGEIKELISELLKEQQGKERLLDDKLDEYQKICSEFIKRLIDYAFLRENKYTGLSRRCNYRFDPYLEPLFIELVRNDEDQRAAECLRCMRDAQLDEVPIYDICFKYSHGEHLDDNDKKVILNSTTKSESIARVKILLSDELDYEEEQLLELADAISEPRSGKEYFWAAKRANRDGQYNKIAEDYFKKAFENGETQAGDCLVKMYQDYGKPSLTDLASMMIPEANYKLAMEQSDDNLKDVWVNLKIASAKKHIGAIKIVAEWLFKNIEELSLSEMEDPKNKEDAINAIIIYEFLLKNDYKEEYQLRIGLIYIKLQDYRRALDHLESLDDPEAMYQCALIYENGLGVAENKKKARDYYKKCGNYKDASVQFVKISEAIRQNNYNDQNFGNGFREEREVVSVERSGHCFITTAACIALDKDKDCDELNILRHFRDFYIADGRNGDLLITEYYRIGPEIVNRIEKEWNPFAIYMQLWRYYINPSCRCIAKEKFEEAKNIYIAMVKRLCIKYQIKVDERICKEYDIKYG